VYEEIFTVGILTSGLLGLNTAEASEVEKDMIEVDPLIENLKTKHPDWAITQVTLDEAAKVKEELENHPVLRGPAPPLTALYIDQKASQVGTINQQTEGYKVSYPSRSLRI